MPALIAETPHIDSLKVGGEKVTEDEVQPGTFDLAAAGYLGSAPPKFCIDQMFSFGL